MKKNRVFFSFIFGFVASFLFAQALRIEKVEYAKLSLPMKMNFADSTLTPYTDFFYCWSDRNLNFDDSEISSPLAKAGLSFGFGRVDWIGNFRQGITADFDGGLGVDFRKNDFVPYFSAQIKAYKAFQRF